jgi:hypothetical protein
MKPLALALWLVACRATPHSQPAPDPRPAPRPENGSAADSKIEEGRYEGYEVARRCRVRDCVGVTGTGAQWWPGMERERIDEDARFRAGFERFRAEVMQALEGERLRTVHGSSLGGGCSAFGLILELTSWRELDPAIVRIGELLRTRDLREPVTLCVNSYYIVPLGEAPARDSN